MCLANFALHSEEPLWVIVIYFLDFYCLQVLNPEKKNLYENMHVSKLLCNLVVENKQHKQLIDRAKPDDIHLPFQQFLLITILIYTAAF